jgi:peptidoglycan hydrolase-like protein with peptidoglycan-binding domain
VVEAEVAARAVQTGADCLLIDAEGEYQGRYVAAQEYMSKLRSLVGSSYPIGLASFPYVDYHPSFPYSVFLGPGGAQYNVPQMYWHLIGTTVDTVYSHTYFYNAPYARPIAPLGEVAGDPPPNAIKRFRQLRRIYHAPATSWWDWQESSPQSWGALSATIANAVNTTPVSGMPMLGIRGKGVIKQGDLVVWAQEHLWSAGNQVQIDGVFGKATRTAVRKYQSTHRLTVTGQVNSATWASLLHYSAAAVTWTTSGATVARAASDSSRSHANSPVLVPPRSAGLKARAYEIPAHLGQG